MKNNAQLAEAILRLRGNTDFKFFLNSLGDFGEQLIQQMIYTPEAEQLRTLQGKAQAVTEILKLVQMAEKYRENTQ